MTVLWLITTLMVLPAQPQIEQELRRQEEEIGRLRSLVEAQQSETEGLKAVLEQQELPCTANLESLNPNGPVVGSDDDVPVRLNVIGAVSQPASRCLPASIWVTASYLDADGELICSGTVPDIARQVALTGVSGLEIQPRSLVNFVRWANQPPRTASGPLRLACIAPDGVVEVTALPARPLWLRLRVSLFPAHGGLSTAAFDLELP